MTAASPTVVPKSPRFGGVSTWLVALSSAAMLGLAGLLVYLGLDQLGQEDDCLDADLVAESDCQRLFGDLGTELLIGAAIAVALTVLLVAGLALIGRRDARRATLKDARTLDESEGLESNEDAPIRVCPVCSAQSQTRSDTCPHCGSSFIRVRRVRAGRKLTGMSRAAKVGLVVAALLVPLAAAGGARAVLTANDHEDEAGQLAIEELDRQEAEAAERAEERKEAAEEAERKVRQVLVRQLQTSITNDAQKESEKSFAIVKGPILETQCDPEGGEIDIEAISQDFDCLAVRRFNADGTASGYSYRGTVNYNDFSYTWQLGR